MCILLGPEFVVEIANERMFEMLGKAQDKLLGKPLFQELPEVSNQGFEQLLQSVLTTGKTVSDYGVSVFYHATAGCSKFL